MMESLRFVRKKSAAFPHERPACKKSNCSCHDQLGHVHVKIDEKKRESRCKKQCKCIYIYIYTNLSTKIGTDNVPTFQRAYTGARSANGGLRRRV